MRFHRDSRKRILQNVLVFERERLDTTHAIRGLTGHRDGYAVPRR